MADVDDKEKAEKLAAAKKRFEQLKKQKGKKGGKKKTDKSEASETKEDDTTTADPPAEAEAAAESETRAEAEPEAEKEEGTATGQDAPTEETSGDGPAAEEKGDGPADDETPEKDGPTGEEKDKQEAATQRPAHARQPSSTQQSRQRSESFRQNSAVSPVAAKPPGLGSISAEDEVQDIYRKQASRIEELDKENKTLRDGQARLQRVEDELEQLRESSGDVAELKSKAALADQRQGEVEKLTADVASLQRQLAQAQQQAHDKRRKSNASPARELGAQLAAKTSAIESLELELSNLRNQHNLSQSAVAAHEAAVQELRQRAATAEAAAETARSDMATLRDSVSAGQQAGGGGEEEEDAAALQTRVAVLESDLRTAKADADAAAARAASLEQKIETLTKVHKDAAASHDRDVQALTSKLASLHAKDVPASDDGRDDDPLGPGQETLHARIRHLEAENYDLKRGVWREQRLALQPDINDASPAYEDVDLSNPYAAAAAAAAASRPHARTSSSFQDVLQSGISAFTGRDRRASLVGHDRRSSLGLLSEEGFDFDEDAFAAAQQEEGKKRIERVRDIKRGLEGWRGWRLDLSDVRAGGLGAQSTGPLFDV